jgi:hypothetical protein
MSIRLAEWHDETVNVTSVVTALKALSQIRLSGNGD